MITSKKSLFYIVGFSALLIVTVFLFFLLSDKNNAKLVYVDNAIVFSEFNLFKDLSKSRNTQLKHQKKYVDSLASLLNKKASTATSGDDLKKQFIKENNRLNEMNRRYTKEVNAQVWNRLNAYMREFGEQNDYQLILGTRGDGNIMHAAKKLDVTKAFIKFANDRYEGNSN
ncbi:OmpH family outer membrane protein [Mesonia maritima]|uniref:Outer membrane protein n=1 Tax=Mesonia maritima TaxID=1793873 RepID=A0ABU1K1B6_9FLAO|nr:OmpH family outer membrane protein [Mesonia maritima]MDR6299394.1 outer membrane protein [Mesonia maritima]